VSTEKKGKTLRIVTRTVTAAALLTVFAGTALLAIYQGTSEASSAAKTLVYVAPALPLTFDPCYIQGDETAEINQNLYAGWTQYKTTSLGKGQTGDLTAEGEKSVTGGVFKSWTISKSGLVYKFTVRQGVRDSTGAEMTAADVKWDFARFKLAGCSYIGSDLELTNVDKQVEVTGKYSLTITIPKPDPIFLRILAVNNSFGLGPSAQSHATASDPMAAKWASTNSSASTGPYKVQSFTPGVQLTLVPNPYYYGPKPKISEIVYKEVPSDANRTAILLSGQAQVTRDLTQTELNTIQKSGKATVSCTTANDMLNLALDTKSGPTANPEVRQAIADAVPYSSIINSVYDGRAKRLYGMLPADFPDALGAKDYPYDTNIAKAKKMLAAAGYPHGFSGTIMIVNDVPEHEQVAILLQSALKQLGITLTIKSTPVAPYDSALNAHSFGTMAIWQNHSLVLDPDYQANLFLATGPAPSLNWSGWVNKPFIKLQTEAVSMADGSARNAVLTEMQKMFNQNLPWVALANTPICFAFAPSVTGYQWHTFNEVYFSDLSIT
jgi:peptide/nickel transport system substrate-binding protein